MIKINYIFNPQPTLGGLTTNSPPFFKGGVRGRFHRFRQIIISFIATLGLFFCLVTSTLATTSLTHQTNRFKTSISHSDFTSKENPQITIEEKLYVRKGILKLIPKFIYSLLTPPPLKSSLKLIVKDANNLTLDNVKPSIEEIDGKISVSIDKNQLKPGRYSVEIISDGSPTIAQDFTWGVLAINTNKSVYSIGNTAVFSIAVLDEHGAINCNADISLDITLPDGQITSLSTTNGLIKSTKQCRSIEVSTLPDYQALFNITQNGNYKLTLTAITNNGSYSINDSFNVEDNPAYVIERLSATRIYPKNQYPVTLKITANQNFSGTITETVPSSFKITNTNAKIITQDDRQLLTWKVSLSAGQTTTLKYTYKAPNVSPEFYLLGPLVFSQNQTPIYQEPRAWQIASDAPGETRTKTVKFFIGQDSSSAGVGTGVTWPANFSVYLPDIISSPTAIKSAYIDYSFQNATTTAAGYVTLRLKLSSEGTYTTAVSANYSGSGENFTQRFRANFTDKLKADIQSPGTYTYNFSGAISGTSQKAANAIITITYDYDSLAPTQLNTARFYGGQNGNNIAVGSSTTFTLAQPSIPENSASVYSAWAEITGNMVTTGTTDETINIRYDSDTATSYYLDNVGGTAAQTVYLLHPKNITDASHTLSVEPTAGYPLSLIGYEQYITYSFDYSASTSLLTTQEIMILSNGTRASTSDITTTKTINLPESSISWKSIYVNASAHAIADNIVGLTAKLNSADTTFGVGYTYDMNTETYNNYKILSNETNDLNTMSTGDNNVYLAFHSISGGISDRFASLVLTYAHAKTDPIVNASANFLVANGRVFNTGSTSPFSVGITGSTQNVTAYMNAHFRTAGTGTTGWIDINVLPSSNTRYNYATTGEYRIVDIGHTLSTEVGATGSYIATLNNTVSSVKDADITLNYQYYNLPPSTPTLISPTDSAIGISQTPSFVTVATDTNENILQYEVKICTDSGMSTGCQTFTAANTGWSGADIGTSSFSAGTTATYVLQVGNSLATDTTYYWKTRAIDPAGSNTYSSTQTTAYSFTTYAPPAPPVLDQTSFRWRLDNGGEDIGSSSFATGITYPTISTNPISVTSADVNGDGKPDLVTANNGSNDITVFNNNGNGTFATGTTYPTLGGSIQSVTSTDVNGDGKADLITINTRDGGYGSVNVFINNGYGIYGTGTTYPNGYFSSSINTADINGDGKPDLVSTNYNDNTISVFNNNGNGTFATRTTYPTLGTGPASVTSTDVNGDGKLDLVSANADSNNITVFNNNGNGTFSTGTTYPTIGTGPISVTSADVNGDGLPDLVTANYIGNNITVFNNNGNGTFTIGITYPTLGYSSQSVTSADVNNDGKVDLVTANWNSNNITIFNNNGNGTFGTGTTYPTIGTHPFSVTSADVNSDGKTDLVTANQYGNNITVFTNIYTTDPDVSPQNIGITNISSNSNIRLRFSIANTGGSISSNFRLQIAPKGGSTNCTDVTSDNFTDVTTTVGSNLAVMTTSPNFTNQQSTSYQLFKPTTFATGTTYPVLGGTRSVTSADVNGDGKADLVSVNQSSNNITVFNNNGNGTFATGTTYPTPVSGSAYVISSDVNVDGKPDLITANSYSNNIAVFNNNGNGTFATGTTYPTKGSLAFSVTSADVNVDGLPDLITANNSSHTITVFTNNGNGTFATGTTYPTIGWHPMSVTSADVNGDGKADLISANNNPSSNNITVFNNNGDGTFGDGTTYPTIGSSPYSVTSADVNGDGKPDLVTANQTGNNITVFNNNGNGTFATGTTYPTIGTSPNSVTASDINGDSKPDLITANFSGNNITVFNNNGNGTFATGTTYPTLGTGPASVTSTDVNGDGKPDLVSANASGNNITVFTNNGNGAFVAGKMVENPSNQTDSITLGNNEFTEVEYNFQMTDNIDSLTPYCFRVVDAGTTLSTYTNVALLTTAGSSSNQAPTSPTALLAEGQSSPVTEIIDLTPELSAIYNDPDTDIANKYQIQVDDSSGFGSPIWDSGASGTTMTNCNKGTRCSDISYGGSALNRGTVYYWRIKFWDDDGLEGAWSAGTDTFRLNQLPSTPTNNTPSVGATDVALNPTLTASVYSDPDSDPQSYSQWQISTGTGAGFATAIVYDSGTTTASNTINVGYTLSNSTVYYWRVRYQDNNTEWSAYSTDTGFTSGIGPTSPPPSPFIKLNNIKLNGLKFK